MAKNVQITDYIQNAINTEVFHTIPVIRNGMAYFKVVTPDEGILQFTLAELHDNNGETIKAKLAEVASKVAFPKGFLELYGEQNDFGMYSELEGKSDEDCEYLYAVNALISVHNMSSQTANENGGVVMLTSEILDSMHRYMHYKGDCSVLHSLVESDDDETAYSESAGSVGVASDEYNDAIQEAQVRKLNTEASAIMLSSSKYLENTHEFDVDTGLLVKRAIVG